MPFRRRGVIGAAAALVAALAFAIIVGPKAVRARDVRRPDVRGQLQAVQTQIELYYSVARRYPTLAELQRGPVDPDAAPLNADQSGWGALIDAGLLTEAPKNPAAPGHSTRVAATPQHGAGWHYDQATGKLGACYFDEEYGLVTPEKP